MLSVKFMGCFCEPIALEGSPATVPGIVDQTTQQVQTDYTPYTVNVTTLMLDYSDSIKTGLGCTVRGVQYVIARIDPYDGFGVLTCYLSEA